MNQLSQYLTREGVTQSAFAERLGLTQATVSRLASGLLRPRLDTALAIERITAGAVPVESWAQQEGASP